MGNSVAGALILLTGVFVGIQFGKQMARKS